MIMSKDDLINYAIQSIKVSADKARHISSGNVSHDAKSLEGGLKRLYEFLEKHKDDEINDRET